jgi:hypothetical protein
MGDFSKNISGVEFNFHGVREGGDLVYRVSVETHHFKMITDEEGNWGIWQQVPLWIKKLEEQLEKAIEEGQSKLA